MRKQEIIDKFKESCQNPIKDHVRERAVMYQVNRFVWEIEHEGSAIRIQTNGKTFMILIWEQFYNQNTRYSDWNKAPKPIQYQISEQEYNELEAIYCDLSPNIIL